MTHDYKVFLSYSDLAILQLLRHPVSGQRAQRDIVQFVSFTDFKNDGAMLAREVLIEIPNQFMGYMRLNKIKVTDQHLLFS